MQPLSQRSQPAPSHQQPTQDNSTEQPSLTAAALSQPQRASYQPETWPRPTPHEWHEIELVATWACTALSWALSLIGVYHITVETVQKLTANLFQLIQLLVAGHMPDLDLDMRELFIAGLPAVLTVQHSRREAYTELTITMLSRLAKDSRLVVQCRDIAGHLCSLFCKLQPSKIAPSD